MDWSAAVSRVAFRYQQKETKKGKVGRVSRAIREATGISKGKADDIADALVRNRDVERLAVQKKWPVNDEGEISGDRGTLSFDEARRFL